MYIIISIWLFICEIKNVYARKYGVKGLWVKINLLHFAQTNCTRLRIFFSRKTSNSLLINNSTFDEY